MSLSGNKLVPNKKMTLHWICTNKLVPNKKMTLHWICTNKLVPNKKMTLHWLCTNKSRQILHPSYVNWARFKQLRLGNQSELDKYPYDFSPHNNRYYHLPKY